MLIPLRGLIAALGGRRDAAPREVETTSRNQRAFGHYHHAQHDVAAIYTVVGDHEHALDWLAAAARNGFPCAVGFERDLLLAPLHQSPRFRDLIGELQAECDRYRVLYRELFSGDSGRV